VTENGLILTLWLSDNSCSIGPAWPWAPHPHARGRGDALDARGRGAGSWVEGACCVLRRASLRKKYEMRGARAAREPLDVYVYAERERERVKALAE